jgi:phosphohistidine phosphatase
VKTLLLLRHAKSSWDDASLSDFDRPLNERGLKSAPFIGQVLVENDLRPDAILSSPAQRAKQTALLVRESGDLTAEPEFNDKIYEASPAQLLEVVAEVPPGVKMLLLVGHNPGMEGLLKLLTGEKRSIPTAGLIKVFLNINDWSEIRSDIGEIEMFIKPRDEMQATRA